MSTDLSRVARSSPVVQWGILHQYQTADVGASIRQDVLLMAGSEDHYVPVEQWHRQVELLPNARSITARLFTPSESAESHCQVGNYGLALEAIVNWLDSMLPDGTDPLVPSTGVRQ